MAQDPWDNVPIVTPPQPRASAPMAGSGRITRYRPGQPFPVSQANGLADDGSLTPEEFQQLGFVQENGEWVRPEEAQPSAEQAPWDDIPVAAPLTESEQGAAETAAQRFQGLNRSGQAVYSGLMLGFNDEIAGHVAAGGQMASNAVRRLTGQPIEINSADMRSAVTNRIRQEGGEFAQERPVSNFFLQAGGGALTGGAGIARGTVVGAIGTGAAYGAGYGAGTAEGGFAERLPAAGTGAVVGGLTGGLVQGGTNAAAPYAQRLAGIVGDRIRPATEAAQRMGAGRPDAEVVAARRLVDQMRRRGLNGEQIQEEIVRRQAAGLNPTILDIGGENVMATTRAVASAEGPARQIVSDYRDRVAAELGPRTVARARELTPEYQGSALQGAEEVVNTRRIQAREEYGPAYEEQIVVPDVALRALRGDEGTAAMREARRIASANQDFQTMEEIDRLLVADLDAAPVASGRALETIRRGYADLASASEGEYAMGLQSRLRQIDQGLDEIPQLRDARRSYAQWSQAADALGGVPDPRSGRQVLGRPSRAPQSVITSPAPQYSAYVQGLGPDNALPNQIYQRDQIVRQLANAREGAVGPINAITPGANQPVTSNSAYVAQNLEATFPGQGQRFQQDLSLAREQMTLANRVAPNEGSKSANVLQDQAAEGFGQVVNAGANIATGGTWQVARIGIDNLIRRGSMNEAEREAFARLAIGPAEDLTRIARLAAESRQAGRPPPREVRAYLVRTRNVLGAQNPVTQQLEQLLLPAPVAVAEEGSE